MSSRQSNTRVKSTTDTNSTSTTDNNYVTILAIYDEQLPNGSATTSTNNASDVYRTPIFGKTRDSVVEITSLENPPSKGLRVSTSNGGGSAIYSVPVVSDARKTELKRQQNMSLSSGEATSSSCSTTPFRSSLRSETSTPSRHRVTLSPEVEKRLADTEKNGDKAALSRNSARKSRLTESFFEAKDRLEECRASTSSNTETTSRRQRAALQCTDDGCGTVVHLNDDGERPVGIDVTAVMDMTSAGHRLSAVQVMRIHENGRVALDRRIVVGDQITAINDRPIYQMSIVRVHAYLAEVSSSPTISLTLSRPISSFTEEERSGRSQPLPLSVPKPILSALQQANTQSIGNTINVALTKTNAGFGFTVTGRETSKGEHLLYIGTVKPNSVALGRLRAGDRLLEINGSSINEFSQKDVVNRLKEAAVGETVTLCVSRLTNDEDNKENNAQDVPDGDDKSLRPQQLQIKSDPREMEFIVPLNSSGSAGLGVSLKARVSVKSDGRRQDCGIFIKNILHGGAAFNDGRLQVNDRIVAIEDTSLLNETNAEAGDSLKRRLHSIGTTSSTVRLTIYRASADDTTIMRTPLDQPYSLSSPSTVSCRTVSPDVARRESITSDCLRLDETELSGGIDPFDREAPTRKSISEKRNNASHDPNHIKLFQDIKHQRQTSAPQHITSSSSLQTISTRSASQRAASRVRSQSVHPRHPPASLAQQQPLQSQTLASKDVTAKRRSQSVESTRNEGVATNVDGGAAYGVGKPQIAKTQRGPVNTSFRHAIEGDDHSYGAAIAGSPVIEKRPTAGREIDKQRRKSVGSAMKSLLGFGQQKSRTTSPERERLQQMYIAHDDNEAMRIRQHLESVRKRESEANRQPVTPTSLRRTPCPNYEDVVGSYPDGNLVDRYQAHRYPTTTDNATYAHSRINNNVPSGKWSSGNKNTTDNRDEPGRGAARSDYYNTFNTWFAYSGGGGVGAAPVLKAAFRAPLNGSAGAASRRVRDATVWQQGVPHPAVYSSPSSRQPAQIYSNRFSHF